MNENGKNLFEEIDYLVIEATNYCNLNCSFCNRNKITTKLKHMTIAEFKKILEIFKDNEIKTVKLQGMGEPYLHPNYLELCRILRDYFPNCMIISATNCQHDHFETLSESLRYLDYQYLSIDGLKENYEKFRLGASWEKLISFLERISQLKDSKKCSINFVATEHNYRDIPALIKLSKKYNLGEIRINIAQNWNEEELGTSGNQEEMIEFLKKYKAYVKGKGSWEYKECFWPFRGAYITVFGDVRGCAINMSGKTFGNIFREDFSEIRNSGEFKNLRENLKRNYPPDFCRTCDYKRLSPILERIFKEEETLKNKVVLITGASRGLGRELAKTYYLQGCKLILVSRNEEKLKELKRELSDEVIIVPGDITDNSTLKKIQECIQKKDLDILINNAATPCFKSIKEVTDEEIQKVFDLNIIALIKLTKKAYSLMEKKESGMIVNIISTAGKIGMPDQIIYSSTKFALRGFTESLRKEGMKKNIRVLGVYPGGMKTDIFGGTNTNFHNFMEPKNVAKLICKLTDTEEDVCPSNILINRRYGKDEFK
jgi:radical SAM protein with 4Fe4S-binding SPASM domain